MNEEEKMMVDNLADEVQALREAVEGLLLYSERSEYCMENVGAYVNKGEDPDAPDVFAVQRQKDERRQGLREVQRALYGKGVEQ